MQLIGDHLKKARKIKKIKIKSVSDELNISEYILKKIESNDFSNITHKAYLIGYLRSYANFLELNSEEIIKRYKFEDSFGKEDLFEDLPRPLIKENLFFKTKT